MICFLGHLLVRRSRIIDALKWLISNNPLYADLDLETVLSNAAEYPEHGILIPRQSVIHTNGNTAKGATYTEQANAELFNGNVSPLGIPSSTVVDADHADSTYNMRKLDALHRLKTSSEPYIKFPSGSTPLSTRKNPNVYGYLWPTLFPYGVGMMENDNVCSNSDSIGFRKIDSKKHVSHLLLNGSDRCFQTHLSFIFVMGNLFQGCQTSFNAKLAVKKSWFPRVDALLERITDTTIENYTEKLKNNVLQNRKLMAKRLLVN